MNSMQKQNVDESSQNTSNLDDQQKPQESDVTTPSSIKKEETTQEPIPSDSNKPQEPLPPKSKDSKVKKSGKKTEDPQKSKAHDIKDKKNRLKKKLEKAEKELKEQKEKYEFLNAELENTRKHFLKQKKIESFRTENRMLTKFAPLIDSFESALELKEKINQENGSETTSQFVRGVEQIFNQLKDIFDKYGLKDINTTGIDFDYNLHEVMMKIINDDLPEDTVVQILQRGYMRDGKVIRPAKVIVSKHTPPPPPPPKKEEEKPDESKNQEVKKPSEKKSEDPKKSEDSQVENPHEKSE